MATRVRKESFGAANTQILGKTGSGITYRYSSPHHNAVYDKTNPGPPYKSGGGLLISKAGLYHYPTSSVSLTSSLHGTYQGGFLHSAVNPNGFWGGAKPPEFGEPAFSSQNAGAYMASNVKDLGAWGAIGFNRAKPGKAIVNFGVALAEMRRLPTIPDVKGYVETLSSLGKSAKSRADFFRKLGGDYLNDEFGWKPFISDLGKLLNAQEALAKRLAQLKRDNGKSVRRRVALSSNLETAVTSTKNLSFFFYPSVHPFYLVDGSGMQQSTVTKEERTWFAGSFRYYIEDFDDPGTNARLTRALLGINPTPELLWNALPWTWLIDWFTGIGASIANMSANAAENLVCEYGYVMQEISYRSVAIERGTIQFLPTTSTQTLTAKAINERVLKRRDVASPFGFGLTPADLSDKQGAILGALGISRSF